MEVLIITVKLTYDYCEKYFSDEYCIYNKYIISSKKREQDI